MIMGSEEYEYPGRTVWGCYFIRLDVELDWIGSRLYAVQSTGSLDQEKKILIGA